MKENEFCQKAHILVAEFYQLKTVQDFLELKSIVKNDKKLKMLKESIKEYHKMMVKEPSNHFILEEFKRLNSLYENDPHVINYRVLKDEIDVLIEPIYHLFNFA